MEYQNHKQHNQNMELRKPQTGLVDDKGVV